MKAVISEAIEGVGAFIDIVREITAFFQPIFKAESWRQIIYRNQQEEVRRLRGKLHWEGDLDQMRKDN